MQHKQHDWCSEFLSNLKKMALKSLKISGSDTTLLTKLVYGLWELVHNSVESRRISFFSVGELSFKINLWQVLADFLALRVVPYELSTDYTTIFGWNFVAQYNSCHVHISHSCCLFFQEKMSIFVSSYEYLSELFNLFTWNQFFATIFH